MRVLAAVVLVAALPWVASAPPGTADRADRGGPTVSAPSDTEPGRPLPPPAAPARAPGVDSVEIRGDDGRTVRLPGPARRIVSLVPAVTELLFALGAGDRLVGRTRFGVHPPAARAVFSVGDGVRPSTELVLSRRPDLVVLYAGPDNRGVAGELERVGLPTLAVRHDDLPDLRRNLRRLGRAVGCPGEALALEREIVEGLEAVARATDDLPRRTVYYDVWHEPPITIGGASYLDSLIALAGGRNVFGDLDDPSPQVSLEAIAAREPEVVLWPVGADRRERTPPSRRPGWGALAAVREGAVRRVDGELLHRLGPRVGRAAAALARAIHPEAAVRLPARDASDDLRPRAAGCGRAE